MKAVTHLSKFWISGIVLACAAPTATLNIWPRIAQMLSEGLSGSQLGIVILVAVSALGMTAIPFAMQKAENWGFWLTCLLCGAALCIVNYLMAVGAVGKVRDAESGAAGAIISKAAGLSRSISESRKQRDALPTFRWTTEDMVTAANEAVRLAVEARDQECGKVGEWCRARQAQVASRLEERAGVSANRALSRQRKHLDGEVQRLEQELTGIGSIPHSSDMQASRVAAVVSSFISLGPNAAERVADAIVTILAITAEGIALILPRILVTALSSPRPVIQVLLPAVKAPAPLAIRKQASSRALPAPSGLSVSNWLSSACRKKPGSSLLSQDAFKAYKQLTGNESLSFTAFDFQLREAGIEVSRSGGRTFYKDLELT